MYAKKVKNAMRKQPKPSLINPKERQKVQRRRGKLIFLIITAIIVIQLIAYHQRILTAVGEYLVCQHPLQPADIIVIPAHWDEIIVRAKGGADLYHKGLAKIVFVPRMKPMEGLEEIRQRGIAIPENRDLFIDVLEGLGVPLAAIETSSQEVASTWDEARVAHQYIEQRGYDSVLLVTSKYHSRRAYLIFKDAFKEKATVISVPSPYDPYDPEGWWKREQDRKKVILEYQKILVHYWRKVF
jgi:uncharacterized SAM-binding protein YcdF (DUF218 family)